MRGTRENPPHLGVTPDPLILLLFAITPGSCFLTDYAFFVLCHTDGADPTDISSTRKFIGHTEITALELCSLATGGTQEITESALGTGCAQEAKREFL